MSDEVWIVGVRETSGGATDRGLWDRRKVDREKISADELKTRLTEFVDTMHTVIAGMQEPASGYALDEVQVTVEMGAKGSVSLLGTGGEVSGSGGLQLTFRRAGATG